MSFRHAKIHISRATAHLEIIPLLLMIDVNPFIALAANCRPSAPGCCSGGTYDARGSRVASLGGMSWPITTTGP
jgi:hypothetical protein